MSLEFHGGSINFTDSDIRISRPMSFAQVHVWLGTKQAVTVPALGVTRFEYITCYIEMSDVIEISVSSKYSVIKANTCNYENIRMGEVRSPDQGLKLIMPDCQPCVAGHLAPGMSTSLDPASPC